MNYYNDNDPKACAMNYDYKQALSDLIGQIGAMKARSDKYKAEEEAEGRIDEADKHLRVFCVLKELERLGRAFGARVKSNEQKIGDTQ